jgi:hypothetical protein
LSHDHGKEIRINEGGRAVPCVNAPACPNLIATSADIVAVECNACAAKPTVGAPEHRSTATQDFRYIGIAVPGGISGDELAFLEDVLKEVVRSRGLFPAPDSNGHALQEEAGEVSKALMYEPWANVRKECVQLANMALRLTLEGDVTMFDFRRFKGNDDMPAQSGAVSLAAHHGGQVYRLADTEEPATAEYLNDELVSIPDYSSQSAPAYLMRLNGGHIGPDINVLMVRPHDEDDGEGGRSFGWDMLAWNDDKSRFDVDWLLDTYTDALRDELRECAKSWS